MRISLIAVAVLVLAGCTAKDSAAPSTAPQTSVATDPHTAGAPGEVAATPAPSHNYLSRDGDLYCYPAAVSQDAKEAGQAAEDVLCFRYGGKVNGAYVFTPERDPGTVISCDDPCKVIKFDVYGQTVKRVAFEPGSVIGAAFERPARSAREGDHGSSSRSDSRFAPSVTPPCGRTVADADRIHLRARRRRPSDRRGRTTPSWTCSRTAGSPGRTDLRLLKGARIRRTDDLLRSRACGSRSSASGGVS
jgi:hypothetical protein